MAAQQITESEVRHLTQELHAKDAELRAKDVELREIKEERSAMLLRYVREFTELQKRQHPPQRCSRCRRCCCRKREIRQAVRGAG